jgi:hypothetical protein
MLWILNVMDCTPTSCQLKFLTIGASEQAVKGSTTGTYQNFKNSRTKRIELLWSEVPSQPLASPPSPLLLQHSIPQPSASFLILVHTPRSSHRRIIDHGNNSLLALYTRCSALSCPLTIHLFTMEGKKRTKTKDSNQHTWMSWYGLHPRRWCSLGVRGWWKRCLHQEPHQNRLSPPSCSLIFLFFPNLVTSRPPPFTSAFSSTQGKKKTFYLLPDDTRESPNSATVRPHHQPRLHLHRPLMSYHFPTPYQSPSFRSLPSSLHPPF